jgi:hypothetical protein
MDYYQYYKLKIDDDFKNLIPPLSADEYQQLEQNLIKEGCCEPISIWNGYILDGHNRYEICSRWSIPFQIRYVELFSHEEAIAWICANQLGRRNISEATRKYLIGKRYEAEKIIGTPNAIGSNQYARKVDEPRKWSHPHPDRIMQKTAVRLGDEYHISHNTVSKYGIYAHALDILAKIKPEIVPEILSGQVKMSHENVVELSNSPNIDFKRPNQQLSDDMSDLVGCSGTSREIQSSIISVRTTKPQRPTTQINTGSIKNMPAHDPDAEIESLALTIPSWVSSIDRTRLAANLSMVSINARNKLERQLVNLKKTIEDMLAVIKEER